MTAGSFDAIQADYEAIVENSISFSGLRHDFFMAAKARLLSQITRAHFQRTQDLSLLDVGCGVGRLHPHLRPIIPHIAGCDVSEASVERAQREHPFAQYAVSAPERLPYLDQSFDIAITVCVLHHVEPAKWVAFLQEMRRVVRPGGLAVVIEHNPYNPLTRLAVARCPFDHDAVLLSPSTARASMRQAGFGDVKTRNFLFFPTDWHLAHRLERALEAVPLGAQHAAIGAV